MKKITDKILWEYNGMAVILITFVLSTFLGIALLFNKLDENFTHLENTINNDLEKIKEHYTYDEKINCKLENLNKHNFTQLNNHKEYICVNNNDKTDFIIIADEENNLKVNDNLIVYLNINDEVIHYYKHDK